MLECPISQPKHRAFQTLGEIWHWSFNVASLFSYILLDEEIPSGPRNVLRPGIWPKKPITGRGFVEDA